MNKKELIDAVAEVACQSKKDTAKTVDAFLSVISECLEKGESVGIVGFGTFEVKLRGARKGRNPKTNEQIDIPATKVPTFHPGKTLKELVNKEHSEE